MSNVVITPSIIAKEALMQLENNLVMGAHVHKEYKKEFVKVGSTVNIRKPVKFTATNGPTLTIQDVSEAETNIVVNSQKHVGWAFVSSDLTLAIEDYSERYIKPAMIALAQQVDTDLTGLYKFVWHHRGTPGTTPTAFTDISAGAQLLDESAVPTDERVGVWNPAASWALANGLKGVFVQDIAKRAIQKGSFGAYAGAEHFMDQSVQSFTTGAWGAVTPHVDGGAQNVSYPTGSAAYTQTFNTEDWTASTSVVAAGDVFTIANVNAVNPKTFQSTGALQEFVVITGGTADGSGNLVLTISPPIITSGPYQTVDSVPADEALMTMVGSSATAYPQNLLFHPNAFALVTVPMQLPDGAVFKARESYNGLSLRVIKDYDITNDRDIIRLDILYGVKAIYPELACRITG